jgi:hypothetical protein
MIARAAEMKEMVTNVDEWNEIDARLTYYFTTLQMT